MRGIGVLAETPCLRKKPMTEQTGEAEVPQSAGLHAIQSKDLTGAYIADMVSALWDLKVQKEREDRRKRQAEGIAAAQARGVKFGRPLLERPDTLPEVREAWACGEISAREAGRRLGVNSKTFLAWAKQ